MAINRFAIITDGFGKPSTVTGKDWITYIPRALLMVNGYLNRRMRSTWKGGSGKMGMSMEVT